METRLINISEDVAEIKKDVKYLKGKSINELFEFKYECIVTNPKYDKVWIPLQAKKYVERGNIHSPSFDILDSLLDFMKSKRFSSLLISGQSGQGKTTLLKLFQKKLMINWRKKENILCEVFNNLELQEMLTVKNNLSELEFPREVFSFINNLKDNDHSYKEKLFLLSEAKEIAQRMGKVQETIDLVCKLNMGEGEARILPIWLNLPSCPDPLQNLVQFTLNKVYGFDERRISQLKEKARKENPKYK